MGGMYPTSPSIPAPKDMPKSEVPPSEQKAGTLPKPLSLVDISHYSTVSDWAKLKENVVGVYTKATQGVSFVDPKLKEFIEKANSVGLPLGVYHVIECNKSVIDQIDFFRNTMSKMPQIKFRMRDSNDFETEVNKYLSPSENKKACMSFNAQLSQANGYKTIFYCNTSDLREFMFTAVEALNFDMWLASYRSTMPDMPIGGVRKVLMWQHSDSWLVPGIGGSGHTDHDYLYGSINDLLIHPI